MAFYNGWKMTLVVLAGLPIIGLANRIQQNETDAAVEPEGVEAVSNLRHRCSYSQLILNGP